MIDDLLDIYYDMVIANENFFDFVIKSFTSEYIIEDRTGNELLLLHKYKSYKRIYATILNKNGGYKLIAVKNINKNNEKWLSCSKIEQLPKMICKAKKFLN